MRSSMQNSSVFFKMMMEWITFVSQLILLGPAFLPPWVISGSAWEIKTVTAGGDPYSPPRSAISLRDHNIAFTSSAYCVTTVNYHHKNNTIPNELSRDLCDECASCTWRHRHGFTTEVEWQAAVNAEMVRLESGCQVGSWIVEVPVNMELSLELMDGLSSTLGISLENLVVAPTAADGGTRRRYFVVSATPEHMEKAMLYAEFTSATPIPPRLKIHPILEEAATAERAGVYDDASPRGLKGSLLAEWAEDDDEEELHALYTELARSPPGPPLLSSAAIPPPTCCPATHHSQFTSIGPAKNISDSIADTTRRTGGCGHPLLRGEAFSSDAATKWVEVVASRHGRAETTQVIAEGEHSVTVLGLHSRAEVYAAALDIAMHGAVHWVAPHGVPPPPTPADVFASKVSQKWPPPRDFSTDFESEKSIANTWGKQTPPLYELGLFGQGAVVGVSEFGAMDYNSCFFHDTRVEVKFEKERHKRGRFRVFKSTTHRKLRQYIVGGSIKGHGGILTTNLKHGTQVAGAVVGALDLGPPETPLPRKAESVMAGEGAAPNAKVAYFEEIRLTVMKKLLKRAKAEDLLMPHQKHDAPFQLDLAEDILPRAYDVGARVFSYSNSLKEAYNYGRKSGKMDAYCYRNQDFVVLVCAGNEGVVDKKYPDAGTVFPPGDAKSVVTVGSHANALRFEENNGEKEMHLMQPDALSYFSNVGPTVDGRIKPEVCGPGEDILLPSPGKKKRKGGTKKSCEVEVNSGTSFATPVLAGITVLVREYFTEGYYPWTGKKMSNNGFEPMGALLKAILVNSARALFGKEQFVKETDLPTMEQGWGGVDISTTLITRSSPEGTALKVFGKWSKGCADCPQLYETQSCEYTFQVVSAEMSLPLKITLVWFDFNGGNHAIAKTINNLDLSVVEIQKGGSRTPPLPLFPNGGNGPDTKNTVEHIEIKSRPLPGTTYKVKVKGEDVAILQPFALVISGPFDSSDVKVKYNHQDNGRGTIKGRCG